ncbi:MAG: bifunctional oligoribonuclease/PAP phosphatase NrnA [Lachnospiraceae bacterium]|nr:bifunctional oligoribonuclease/PAP phosphatase NrnA [Lachnospiraceae bacterium]
MSELLETIIGDAGTIGICGHIHPDGDSVGSVLGCYLYLKNVFPDAEITPYLDQPGESFRMLTGIEQIRSDFQLPEEPFDVFISLDCGSADRMGKCQEAFDKAKKTISIDHHITNTGFGQINFVEPYASSACEVLFGHLDREKIDLPTAEALYVGIMHDTGVFKYSCTSEKTMNIAGFLMSKGIDTANLIDQSFYMKTFKQLKAMGYALNKAELQLGGKAIITVLTKNDMEKLGITSADTEGIVSELRTTDGVECAVFVREDAPQTYKFSLRSNGKVDVSAISSSFDGGGHKMAAGFTAKGELDGILTQVYAMIMLQL